MLHWKGAELLTCARDNIPGAHMVTVYLPKAAALESEDFISVVIAAQNDGT